MRELQILLGRIPTEAEAKVWNLSAGRLLNVEYIGEVKPEYPKASTSVDIVLFSVNDHWTIDKVLLIERKNNPFKGLWAFPGGFHEPGETLRQAAIRELREETSIQLAFWDIEPLCVRDDPERDPREHVISHVFTGLILSQDTDKAKAADDAANLEWVPVGKFIHLALDHYEILEIAMAKYMKNGYRLNTLP